MIVNNSNHTLNNKSMKILVAEDDMFNMILAKTMIKNILPNVELIEAHNGIEAIDMTFKFYPDLIFMDVQMPELDGNDATKIIRSREDSKGVRTPIIGLTAGILIKEKEKCLLSGMDDYLTKPIDSTKLKLTLSSYLEEKISNS